MGIYNMYRLPLHSCCCLVLGNNNEPDIVREELHHRVGQASSAGGSAEGGKADFPARNYNARPARIKIPLPLRTNNS